MSTYPEIWIVLRKDEGKWNPWNTYTTPKGATRAIAWYQSTHEQIFGGEMPELKAILYSPKKDVS